MKFGFWILVAAIGLMVGGCGPDKPAESSAGGGVGTGKQATLSQPGAEGTKTAADNQPEMSMPVPPPDAQYTLLCMSFTGENHILECNKLKNDLLRLTKLKDWYVIHSEKESDLYYGFYTTVDDKTQPEEVERVKNDRAQVGAITNNLGDRLFGNVIPVLINSPDPIAPKEWEISQCKGYWTLQIAVYRDSPQRKQAAVDSVKDARARGIEAYYHHSPDSSEVFIGSWPESSVDIQNLKQPENTDPTKPLLVVSHPIPGVVNGRVRNRKGEEMQVVNAPTYVVVDPTLKEAIATYPYTLVNGRLYGRPAEGKGNEKTAIPDPSFLVKVPRPGDATAGDEAASKDGDAPDAPTVGPTGQSDSEMGNLKTFGQ